LGGRVKRPGDRGDLALHGKGGCRGDVTVRSAGHREAFHGHQCASPGDSHEP
jgi:hypothetical protein